MCKNTTETMCKNQEIFKTCQLLFFSMHNTLKTHMGRKFKTTLIFQENEYNKRGARVK